MFEDKMSPELLFGILILIAIFFLFRYLPRGMTKRLSIGHGRGISDELKAVTTRLTGLEAGNLLPRSGNERAWVIELVKPGGRPSGLYLLLYHMPEAAWPDHAAFRVAEDDSRALAAQGGGGLAARLVPLNAGGSGHLGPNWDLYTHHEDLPPTVLLKCLADATLVQGNQSLLAITLSGNYLGLWATSIKLRDLLTAGARVRDLVQLQARSTAQT